MLEEDFDCALIDHLVTSKYTNIQLVMQSHGLSDHSVQLTFICYAVCKPPSCDGFFII